jgi:hypothetical protein
MIGSGPQDLYAVLGVAPTASAEAIRRAYRELARRLHPDVDPGGGDAFRHVSAAYEVLGDARRRAAYDLQRASAGGRAIGGPAAERRAPAPTGNVGPSPMPRRVVVPQARSQPSRDGGTPGTEEGTDEWRSLASLARWVAAALVAAAIVFTLLAVAEAGKPAAPTPAATFGACRTPVGSVDCRTPPPTMP